MQRKWPSLTFIFAVKLVLFLYMANNFRLYWPDDQMVGSLFAVGGDTEGYYTPAENAVNGNGYNSVCRMPGLLPIYFPLRWILSETATKVAIVLLQFLAGVVSVRALGLTAKFVFGATAATLTMVVYAFSTFVSVWDHYGYSDSFSVSFLIFSVYLLFRYRQVGSMHFALCAGLFFCWSVFFRPIGIVVLPVLLFDRRLFRRDLFAKVFGASIVFTLPLVVALAAWLRHNHALTGRWILLQDDMASCYPGAYPPHYQKLRDLSTAWGGDYQRTTVGDVMHWFLDKKINYRKENPFSERIFTPDYNIDSLILLREHYHASRSDTIASVERQVHIDYVTNRSQFYRESYIAHHFFDYAITNKVLLLVKFCFPLRLDYLPLPKLSDMTLFQKVFKGSYMILFHLVNLLGISAGIWILARRRWTEILFYGIPFTFLVVLGLFFGFIEMRYLAPVYPFFVVVSCAMVLSVIGKFRSNRNASN